MIVDASICIAWSFEAQRTPENLEILRQVAANGAFAPQLWPVEVVNVVSRARRRGTISNHQFGAVLAELRALPIEIDSETTALVWGVTARLADKYGLTVYDATYLELAIRKQLPLATLDDELIIAARAEGVPVLP